MGGGARAAADGPRVSGIEQQSLRKQGLVRIRHARREDILSVGLIERGSFTDPWGSREFSAAIESPHTIFLVAEDESHAVAGYVIAVAVADESEILNLAVKRELREVGIGGHLLDAALAEATSAGALQVFLEVRESNAGARKLYGSRGFGEISRRRGYYRNPVEDALVLRLEMQ